jgi:glycosyltransferase involved in cell wall biosynthesis
MKNFKSIIKKGVNTIYALFNYAFFLIKDYRKIKNCECLFFFPYYHTGGAERVHVNILKAIEGKNCTVIFTMGSATKSFYDAFKSSAKLIELNPILNKRNKWINIVLQKSIIKAINNSNSLKNVFGCNSNYYYQILPKLSSKINKLDLFHAFEQSDPRILDVVTSANCINNRIVINLKAKNDIIDFYKLHNVNDKLINNIEVIQNGIELTQNSYSNKNESIIKIGFIGRWSTEKRPELFLEIAKRIKAKVSNIEFVMAGTGMKSNIDLINNADVTFLGEITEKEKMNDLYKSLHFVLIISVYEGFPMVMMEAMSHGVIPISTNVGGINEHITHNENGLLINEKHEDEIVNSFCNQILNLIKNSKDKDRISRSAFDYASKHFGIDKFNQSYKNLFS